MCERFLGAIIPYAHIEVCVCVFFTYKNRSSAQQSLGERKNGKKTGSRHTPCLLVSYSMYSVVFFNLDLTRDYTKLLQFTDPDLLGIPRYP